MQIIGRKLTKERLGIATETQNTRHGQASEPDWFTDEGLPSDYTQIVFIQKAGARYNKSVSGEALRAVDKINALFDNGKSFGRRTGLGDSRKLPPK
jgi:hypothetical protein